MAFFFGKQYVERMVGSALGVHDKLVTPKKPYYQQRRTINRVRSVVRSEISRFMATSPNVVGVPASADDEDVRAAFSAEQAWRSIESDQKLKVHFGRAAWWMSVTGNGFIKQWWDQESYDKTSQQPGCIKYSAITPFHLFIPDLREPEMEDQPYVIQAQVRPVAWCEMAFRKELAGRKIKPSTASGNQILDDGHLNLSADARVLDSCVVYEAWVKPGATAMMPNGGVIITIDGRIMRYYGDGFPYDHGQFPFTKFEHIPSATFYADSPLTDVIPIQQDYNRISSQVLESAIRMGRPQLLVQKGSVTTSKITNEIGQMIEYRVGAQPPTPLAPANVPAYVLQSLDRALADIEDITGQHDVTRGQAPSGVTAGTAINYLQEKDNQFLSPEYASIESGWEKIASQSVQLFVQFVDIKRKIKTIGADQAFDTIMLSGADLRNGTDVRVEPGSSVGESQAAKRAQIMDMWNAGLITDPNMAFRLMEVGGEQRALDILNAAEKKAQRENIKMKMLKPQDIQMYHDQWQQQQMMQQQQQQMMQTLSGIQQSIAGPSAVDPMAGAMGGQPPVDNGMSMPPGGPPVGPPAPAQGPPGPAPMGGQPPMGMPPDMQDPMGLPQDQAPDPNAGQPMGPMSPPPMIPVDDFDVHAQHILTHNIFRMGQQYEMLTQEQKNEFEAHVNEHLAKEMAGQISNMLAQAPGQAPGDTGGGAGPQQNPNAMLSGNGAAAPAPSPASGGPING
jgi:hypothetical protein